MFRRPSTRLFGVLLVVAGTVTAPAAPATASVGGLGLGADPSRASHAGLLSPDQARILRQPPQHLLATEARSCDAYPAASNAAANWNRDLVIGAIRTYQELVSEVYGTRCPMHPSCSHFALQAVRQRGTVPGLMLAADRLLRCGLDRWLYEIVDLGSGEFRFVDSVKYDGQKP